MVKALIVEGSLALVFLLLGSLFSILLFIHFLFPRGKRICSNDSTCGEEEACVGGVCSRRPCVDDVDCPNLSCAGSFCTSLRCRMNDDCPSDRICNEGRCVKYGATCGSSDDCSGGAVCVGGVCTTCTSNDVCATGEICSSGRCVHPPSGYTAPSGSIFEVVQTLDPSVPSFYYCPTPSTDCLSPQDCSGVTGAPYCVNGVCRCVGGHVQEKCSSSRDCISGLCGPSGHCLPPGGECVGSYGTNVDGPLCGQSAPYCVEGTCRRSSLGAYCGYDEHVALCYDPKSIGAYVDTIVDGPFCVNGRCSAVPGLSNDMCSGDSCTYYDPQGLACVNARCT